MKICMFLPRIDKKYKTKSVKYERKILSMCDSSISKTSERKKTNKKRNKKTCDDSDGILLASFLPNKRYENAKI